MRKNHLTKGEKIMKTRIAVSNTFGDSFVSYYGNTNQAAMNTVEVKLFINFLKKTFGEFITQGDETHFLIDLGMFPQELKDSMGYVSETSAIIFFQEGQVWIQIDNDFFNKIEGSWDIRKKFGHGPGGGTAMYDRNQMKAVKQFVTLIANTYIK